MRNLLIFLVPGALAWQGYGEYRTREARITARDQRQFLAEIHSCSVLSRQS